MNKKDTFILVSLEEDKARKLANVINSESCRKILNHLTENNATETELSKELNIPISTVHYNIKQLSESGLVKNSEFHYSTKGKEVHHYSLANKYIIIAPKKSEPISAKIKKLLPALLGITVGAAILGWQEQPAKIISESAAQKTMAINMATDSTPQVAGPSITMWFMVGGLCAIAAVFLYDIIRERFK